MDEYPEMWEEFIDNFVVLTQVGDDLVPVVPMGRVSQMMEHYHKPLVLDLDTFTNAVAELHANPVEDDLVRVMNENDTLRDAVSKLSQSRRTMADEHAMLESENDKLREVAGIYASLANHMCDSWDNCKYCPFGRFGENMRRKCAVGDANDAIVELGIDIRDAYELMAEREEWDEQGR